MKYKSKERTHRLIAKLADPEACCLDIGYAQHPNLFLNDVIGVDIQESHAPNYIRTYKVNLNHQTLPFREKAFGNVIMADIIEHVENPSRLLREANRVLADGGQLIVSTPSATYYWDVLRNTILWWGKDLDEGQHLSEWTIMGFIRLLKLNGFKVKKMYGTHIAIPFINWKLQRINLTIPTPRLPRISYQVIYDCVKVSEPENKIHAHKPTIGYRESNLEWVKIDNGTRKTD